MSWVNILKKNDNEFKKEIPKKKIEEEVIIFNDPNIKNYEDEFDYKYSSKIIDIKIELKEYIEDMCLPFLDKNISILNCSNNFNDYIKYNSKNLVKIKNKIQKENEEYLRQNEENEENYYYENYENNEN